MQNLEYIYGKSFEGKPLNNKEIEYTRRIAGDDHEHEAHRITALRVIGLSRLTQYRDFVESLISEKEMFGVAEAAFRVLCRQWGDTQRYLPMIKQFLEGVEWDDAGYIRLLAFPAAGEHYAQHRDNDLLETLLSIHENSVDRDLRSDAYRSLGIAMGVSPSQLRDFMLQKNKITTADEWGILPKVKDLVRNS